MPSIIEGYNYDIFISYRQNDNKYDGWVTEFVDNLNKELEANIKDKVSVYFDANPQDGLLETDSVDRSLEDKLKCLIFIPIISRTYCDSKSFAWQHEFCAFNKLSKDDLFGRDIKLVSGNVTSRILPVKIHDLDPEDNTLLENELGEALRCIEFIYKSVGVNRSLRSNEDHPQDNLNKTYYRDQINKVANAVKEIITAIKKQFNQDGEVPKVVIETKPQKLKNLKSKIVVASVIALVLIVLGYFFIPKLFKPEGTIEKSIAVLPFKLLSEEPDKQYLADGMMDAITLHLSKIKDLRVISRTSVEQYRNPTKTTTAIGRELGVEYLLEGSFQKFGDSVRLIVQLIKTGKEGHLWANNYDRLWKNVYSVQSEVAQAIAGELHTVITPEEKELIEKTPTKNLEAYNSYLQGRFFWNKRSKEGLIKSLEYFEKSVAEDPDYALAYAGLADSYCILAWWGWWPASEGYSKAKVFALRALDIDKNLAEAHATLGDLLCWSEWKWEEARKELKLATELNPNYATAHQYYSEILDIIGRNDEARIQINLALELDPFSPAMNGASALYYYHEGKFKESLDACRKTMEINPDYIGTYWQYFCIYVRQGEDLKAAEALQQFMIRYTLTVEIANVIKDVYSKSGINGLLNWLIELQHKNPAANLYIARLYAMLGEKEEALNWLEKEMEMRSSEISRINTLPDEIPRIYNSPDFDNLRSEPRFLAIIKRMGLSDFAKKE